MGLYIPAGSLGKDPMEGLAAEGLALNGLRMLGDTVGLKGTLAFRKLDSAAWLQTQTKMLEETPEEATLSALNLDAITADTEVPINTVLKEMPDQRKADLIAVCVADGSDEAVVIRAQVKMGRGRKKWSQDAAVLEASWESGAARSRKLKRCSDEDEFSSVLAALQKADNLQHIKKWRHVPVWLAAVDPTDAEEIEEMGVRVVSGPAFWELAIPAVRLAVDGLYESAKPLTESEKQALRAQMSENSQREYSASVQLLDDI